MSEVTRGRRRVGARVRIAAKMKMERRRMRRKLR